MLEHLRSKRASCSSRGVWRTAKWDSTCYYSSTVYCIALASTGYCSSTIDLLQAPAATVHPRAPVHPAPPRAPPPAIVQPALSTGSCSTTPPRATVHPALHRLLFNQPSMGSCSSSPPQGPVHPPPSGSIDRGPIHPAATPRGPVHPTPHWELFNQTPPTTLTVHPEAASICFS